MQALVVVGQSGDLDLELLDDLVNLHPLDGLQLGFLAL